MDLSRSTWTDSPCRAIYLRRKVIDGAIGWLENTINNDTDFNNE